MKKILTATLALLLLLTGCKKTDPVKPDPTPAPTSDRQKEFNDLQLEWFKDEVGSDFVNLHFTLEDPSKYGIEKPEVTLGEVHYGINEDDKKDIQEIKDKLAKLDSFKPEELTEDQQIMLECMRYSLELSLELYEHEDDYTFTFSPNSGVNSNLTTNFTEFAIRDEQDIKDL